MPLSAFPFAHQFRLDVGGGDGRLDPAFYGVHRIEEGTIVEMGGA